MASLAPTPPRVIEVPIDNSNDVLEIDCSQLPSHAAEICDILENEGSALRFYQLFALEYYRQGHTEESIVALKRGMANAKANDQTAKVPLLNFLASIYVQKAKSAVTNANGGDRDMLLQMASTLLTEAERINRSEPNTYLVKGMLAMTKRLPDAALQQFNSALRLEPGCLASLLGKARVLFGKKQFQQALTTYQQILTLRPQGKPDVRIGIGMCLQKLGHVEDARRALERAIEVNPTAAAPHILLATMDLNADGSLDPVMKEAGDRLQSALKQLQRAYELQPDNAVTLTRLADRMFYKSDYEGARKLAERALKTADTMAIQAEAHYQIARAHHAAKRFDVAYEAYQKCLAINEKHVLARYGLGQMQLQRTDMSSAEATFQRVVERHPKCVEVLRALGFLHARLPNNKAKALEYYEKEMQVLADEATEHAKRKGRSAEDVAGWFDDANLFLESGLLYESLSAKKARKAYAMAADILARSKGAGESIPELWNNLGVLGQLTGDEDEAIFAEYEQAVAKCNKILAAARKRLAEKKSSGSSGSRAASEVQRLEGTLVSITYNTARFYEHCGFWEKAEGLYKKILADVPSYVDARLRLAHVAFYCRGNADDSLAQISQAIGVDAKRPAAWLMRGNIELQRKNVQDARRAFEHVLKDIAKHDIYALCSLGNFYLAAGKSEQSRAVAESNPASSTAKKAKELSVQNYKRALEFFDKCLQLDEKCAAAAHGAAIAMAERGFANEARVVFQDVRDAATGGLGDVLLWSGINVAHAYVEVGSYRQAVLAYEASIRRLQETTKILEDASTTKKSCEKLLPAKPQTVAQEKKSAAHVSPDDALILFDLALIEQAVAQLVSELPESRRTLSDLETALTDLEHSTAVFAYLAERGKSAQKKRQRLLYSPRLANERAGYGKSLVAKLARKTKEQELFEQERREHVEKWRKKQEEEEKMKREEEERNDRERREKEARILKETEERNAILRQEMAAAAAEAPEKEGGRDRPKKAKEEDDFISDTDDLFDEPTPSQAKNKGDDADLYPDARPVSKKREPRGRIRNAPSGGHTEDMDALASTSKKRKNNSAADDSTDADAGNSRYKSKAIITDSDDESD
ncbi:TPR-like protein [Martensiomyces pterosporus]|nr:TPR-like protein [Martensiomyces pterosporus]